MKSSFREVGVRVFWGLWIILLFPYHNHNGCYYFKKWGRGLQPVLWGATVKPGFGNSRGGWRSREGNFTQVSVAAYWHQEHHCIPGTMNSRSLFSQSFIHQGPWIPMVLYSQGSVFPKPSIFQSSCLKRPYDINRSWYLHFLDLHTSLGLPGSL